MQYLNLSLSSKTSINIEHNLSLFCFFCVGLTVSEAAKLCSYMHFREPTDLQGKSLLEKADLDPSIDFMDALDKDIPKGNIIEYA